MDVTDILSDLNDSQRQAVSAPIGKTRVLAGAGSGKTRVLVHRIAWILQTENTSLHSILAVTFTNKAAGEMRQRIENMLSVNTTHLWIGTFHSICHKILRIHYERAGLSKNFQILDQDDQNRLVKRIMQAQDISDETLKPKQVANAINHYKENGKRHQDVYTSISNPIEKQINNIYYLYEENCKKNSLVDFAELLIRTSELLRDDLSLCEYYQNRFKHILVDEFQDTNQLQYALIQLLTNQKTDLFVVGDDDQSIYRFRGACIDYILEMQKQYPDLTTVKLEQNYRSSKNILAAANAIIVKNKTRLDKVLWTDSNDGEPIEIYQSLNEYDESYYVLERIKSYIQQGGAYQDCAILYRSNAQSRIFEEGLIAESIAYRVYGGLRFFDRAEIKDAIAYLRLAENNNDDVAFERIINVPPRGIGLKTLDIIRGNARDKQISLWQSAKQLTNEKQLSARATTAIFEFLLLIESMYQHHQEPLAHYLKKTIHLSGIRPYIQTKKIDKKEDKLENLDELINAAEQFSKRADEFEGDDITTAFLAQSILGSEETQASRYSDAVQLMTIHSAKGLEFKQVFMVGVEEGLFPHSEAAYSPTEIEEERRLAYVGITRAREKLHISYAEKRRLYGTTKYPQASRFIDEIPDSVLLYIRGAPNRKRTKLNTSNATSSNQSDQASYQLGMLVKHPKFGPGTITMIEGQGEQLRLQVNFEEVGSKWLIAAFANLAT